MIRKLGYLGLIPFIALPLFLMLPLSRFGVSDPLIIRAFTLYSICIAAFMAGTLWGREIDRNAPKQYVLLVSNAVALCVITLALIADTNIYGALIGLTLAHLLNFFCERYKQHERYFLLRKRLTSVVVVCHATMLAVLTWNISV